MLILLVALFSDVATCLLFWFSPFYHYMISHSLLYNLSTDQNFPPPFHFYLLKVACPFHLSYTTTVWNILYTAAGYVLIWWRFDYDRVKIAFGSILIYFSTVISLQLVSSTFYTSAYRSLSLLLDNYSQYCWGVWVTIYKFDSIL